MRHQDKIKIQRRRRRKLFWLFAAAAVSALLLEEQASVLYVLLALAICGVMMVLAFSNLQARGAEMQTAAFRESSRKWEGETGYITKPMLLKYIGDLTLPIYYLAGPAAMVTAMRVLIYG